MTFTTITFAVFLGVLFALYWTVRGRMVQNALLVGASYLFYSWWDYRFCCLIVISSLVDYGVGLGLNRATSRRSRRLLLAGSCICNLGLLCYFKYFNFFAEGLQNLAGMIGWRLGPVALGVVLPVGISFYTFQTMSYTIDIYRGKMKATTQLVAYLAYVSFFPQLVAGPIERATRLLPQFMRPRHFRYPTAVDGCRQILWGLFKKLALADNLAAIVDKVYASPGQFTGPQLAFATLCFAFQIYCDFSAYSDIAVGTSRLFGIDLMRNFAYPYFSRSVGEFWRRWHISLSTWFRDYVFIPLGGSRIRRLRVAANVMVTFMLSGLWHGASWNFVVWGALNGAAILPGLVWRKKGKIRADDVPGGEGRFPGVVAMVQMIRTFLVIGLSWVFFRANDLGQSTFILRRMALDVLCPSAYQRLDRMQLALASIALLLLAEWIQRRHRHVLVIDSWPRAARWCTYTAVLWLALGLTPPGTGQFVYFQF